MEAQPPVLALSGTRSEPQQVVVGGASSRRQRECRQVQKSCIAIPAKVSRVFKDVHKPSPRRTSWRTPATAGGPQSLRQKGCSPFSRGEVRNLLPFPLSPEFTKAEKLSMLALGIWQSRRLVLAVSMRRGHIAAKDFDRNGQKRKTPIIFLWRPNLKLGTKRTTQKSFFLVDVGDGVEENLDAPVCPSQFSWFGASYSRI